MDVHDSMNVGVNPSIAAFPDLNNKDRIMIGISYHGLDQRRLYYAYNAYDKFNDRLESGWVTQTIDKQTGNVSFLDYRSSLTFDLKTGTPVIAYNLFDKDVPDARRRLLCTAFVGEQAGNCGPRVAGTALRLPTRHN